MESPRLKIYLYGPSGVGKTIFGLHMPNPCIIDFEDGMNWYKAKFPGVEYLETPTIDDFYEVIEDKIKDPGDTKTLVIDSITKYYELVQEKHLKYLRKKTNNPKYEFQPLDWRPIKNEMKMTINKLLALDMNIVAIAQDKAKYSTEAGEFMKVIGTTADAPKEVPFMFDVVLELSFDKEGRNSAITVKDRTNTLPIRPDAFIFSHANVVKGMNVKELEREPVKLRTEAALAKLTTSTRKLKIDLDGKEIYTAGISAETLTSIKTIIKNNKLDTPFVTAKLSEDYSVSSLLDLREDEGKLFLKDITPQDTNKT